MTSLPHLPPGAPGAGRGSAGVNQEEDDRAVAEDFWLWCSWPPRKGHTVAALPGRGEGGGLPSPRQGSDAAGDEAHPLCNTGPKSVRQFGRSSPIASYRKMTWTATSSCLNFFPTFLLLPLGKGPETSQRGADLLVPHQQDVIQLWLSPLFLEAHLVVRTCTPLWYLCFSLENWLQLNEAFCECRVNRALKT